MAKLSSVLGDVSSIAGVDALAPARCWSCWSVDALAGELLDNSGFYFTYTADAFESRPLSLTDTVTVVSLQCSAYSGLSLIHVWIVEERVATVLILHAIDGVERLNGSFTALSTNKVKNCELIRREVAVGARQRERGGKRDQY